MAVVSGVRRDVCPGAFADHDHDPHHGPGPGVAAPDRKNCRATEAVQRSMDKHMIAAGQHCCSISARTRSRKNLTIKLRHHRQGDKCAGRAAQIGEHHNQ